MIVAVYIQLLRGLGFSAKSATAQIVSLTGISLSLSPFSSLGSSPSVHRVSLSVCCFFIAFFGGAEAVAFLVTAQARPGPDLLYSLP